MIHECGSQVLALSQDVTIVERIGECKIDSKCLVSTEVVREGYSKAVLQSLWRLIYQVITLYETSPEILL
jgi:hypothetical protein